MKNRDNRIYANKIDYMMDTNAASDVFSGHINIKLYYSY